MTAKPTSGLNPVLLAVVGVLVLAALAVGVIVMNKSAKEELSADAEASPAASAKSARSSRSSPYERTSASAKAEPGREGTRPDHSIVSRRDDEALEEMFVRVSVQAREELKQLRAKHATVYDDPEERRAFGVRLSQITDPQERQRMLRERTEAMRRARAEADAAKSVQDREREKELIALMQVQNLWRMANFVGKNEQLAPEVEAFDGRLAQWLEDSETMDSETFHQTFNALRDTLNDLRRRNAQTTHPKAGPANLPSRRPERNR